MSSINALSKQSTALDPSAGPEVASKQYTDAILGMGWKVAGSYQFASVLASSGTISIPLFDELMIVVRIISMSASTDVPSLRFNADAGANYRSRFTVINATSGVALTDVPIGSADHAELSGLGSNLSRVIQVIINNAVAVSKLGLVVGSIGAGIASSHPKIDVAGNIEWINTTAQINSVELRSNVGVVTFGVGSGIFIFGRNFSGSASGITTPLSPIVLTDATTISTDASLGNHFRVTLAGNRTLGNPINMSNGQKLLWEIKQDATGSRTLIYDTKFRFGTDISSAILSTVANKKDFLGGIYNAADDKIDITAFSRGY